MKFISTCGDYLLHVYCLLFLFKDKTLIAEAYRCEPNIHMLHFDICQMLQNGWNHRHPVEKVLIFCIFVTMIFMIFKLSKVYCTEYSHRVILRKWGLTFFAENVIAAKQKRPLPRVCVLRKGDKGFGFHLNGESGERPGQYIRRLQPGSPADVAGMKNGKWQSERSVTNKSNFFPETTWRRV